MKKLRKIDILAMAAALAIHLVVLLVLWLVVLRMPVHSVEEGVPVMLGEVELSSGMGDPGTLNGPDQPTNTAAEEPAPSIPRETAEEPLITQKTEPTVAVKKNTETPKKKETVTPTPPAPPQKTEAQRAEEERQAHARAEAQRKVEEERARAAAANSRVAGALGRGSGSESKGTSTTGTGSQGSPTGNSSTGANSGVGGRGTVALAGRSLRGSLPLPGYNVNVEGDVMIRVVVNASGAVISTSVDPRGTNTSNTALRSAALAAAKRAAFNTVEGADNQTGTITYHFRLK